MVRYFVLLCSIALFAAPAMATDWRVAFSSDSRSAAGDRVNGADNRVAIARMARLLPLFAGDADIAFVLVASDGDARVAEGRIREMLGEIQRMAEAITPGAAMPSIDWGFARDFAIPADASGSPGDDSIELRAEHVGRRSPGRPLTCPGELVLEDKDLPKLIDGSPFRVTLPAGSRLIHGQGARLAFSSKIAIAAFWENAAGAFARANEEKLAKGGIPIMEGATALHVASGAGRWARFAQGLGESFADPDGASPPLAAQIDARGFGDALLPVDTDRIEAASPGKICTYRLAATGG